jgi:predicted outer membrane protein
MQKNKTLQALLAVAAVAAMFSAVGVQAQTAVSQTPSQTGTSSVGKQNTSGKTTREGTIDNSNSTGMENRSSGMAGHSAASPSMGASGAGQSAAGTGAKLNASDEKILKDMAMADMAEVEGGKLAQSKSQNGDVKSFAQQMIDDHTSNLNDVKALAQARGVTLPTEPDAKHKAMAAKLEKMSGDAFDKAYMKQAGVQDHKAVHAKLMAAAKKAKDPELKALVEKTEPVVAQHLKSAEQMPMAKSGTTSGK